MAYQIDILVGLSLLVAEILQNSTGFILTFVAAFQLESYFTYT